MDNLTELDYKSLVEFNDSLDSFLKKVTHACDKMESGISFCKGYMQDEPSTQILRESNHVVNQIRECIDPTRKVQEKIADIISLLESGYGV